MRSLIGSRSIGVVLVWALTTGVFAGAAAGDEPTLRFLAPVGPVTGTVVVVVETDASSLLLDMSLDGSVTWEALNPTLAGDLWEAEWDTGDFSGTAVLRARSGVSSAELEVVVDNELPDLALAVTPQRFSPNNDGRKDRTRITVQVDETATLQVEVVDLDGVVRREWKPGKIAPGTTTIPWAGRGGGRVLPDGRYRIRAGAVDEVGLRTQAHAFAWIDTIRPRIVRLEVGSPIDATAPVEVRYTVRDAAPELKLRLWLEDGLGTIRTRRAVRDTGKGVLRIASRRHGGRRLFPGPYRIRLEATDPAANSRSRSRSLLVLRRVPPQIYRRLENTGRKVALTFDDCVYSDSWVRILDTLKKWKTKATFFCPGERVLMYPQVARRVVEEGHTPAAHGWGHPWCTRLSAAEISDLLTRDRRAWASVGGVSVPYFRPPYGAYNSKVLDAAAAAFHPRVMLWDVSAGDTSGATGQALVRNVVANARSGSIILMHVKPETAAMLPRILDGLRAKGLHPVTVPELFRAAGLP